MNAAVVPTHTPEELQAALDKAVMGLLRGKASSFLTAIYCAHEVVFEKCGTAFTTGKKLALDPDWFMGLTEDSRVFLLAHECWHVAWMHTDPATWVGREHRTLNKAMDHVINLMLLDHGYTFVGDGCFDARFKDHTTDQVYNVLMNEKAEQEAAGCPPTPCNGGDGGTGPSADMPFGQDVQAGTAAEAADTLNTVLRAVTLAQMSKQAGDLPGELLTRIDNLLNPRLPWNVLVRRWLNQVSRQGYSWKRPNRRYQALDMYLPDIHGEEGLDHLMFAMDASGSMDDGQLQVLNTEVYDVKTRFNPKNMTLLSFDTKVRQVWEIDEDTDFTTLDFEGRGGTSLHPVWEYAKKRKPTALVVLSDLFCEIPPELKGIPVLWICLDNPQAKVPYGTLVHLDSTK